MSGRSGRFLVSLVWTATLNQFDLIEPDQAVYQKPRLAVSLCAYFSVLRVKPNLVLFLVSAIQTCVSLLRQGRPAPHREARQKRREMRLRQQAEQEELELRMRELQVANEAKQQELEKMRKVRRRRGGFVRRPPSAMWASCVQQQTEKLRHVSKHVPGRTNWNVARFSIGSDPTEGEDRDM